MKTKLVTVPSKATGVTSPPLT